MDVFFNENALVGFTVAGIFREGANAAQNKRGSVRSFSRNFMVKIGGAAEGLSIISDTLTITVSSTEQINQFAQTTLPSTSETSSPSSSQPTIPVGASPVVPVISDQMKAQMVTSFSAQSGMNENFSRMALEHNQWDYARAGDAFLKLKADNQVPAEAFIQ